MDAAYQPPQAAAFDVATGTMIGRPIPISDHLEGQFTLALDADGSHLAVAGGVPGEVRIFDVADGQLRTTVAPASDADRSGTGRDTASAGWGLDGRLYVGSSGTHLRVFDPTNFALIDDITVPRYATGGVLKFSATGNFVVARGVTNFTDGSQTGSVVRIDLGDESVDWTIGPDEYGHGQCDSIAYSVPDDRLWCGDYFGVIRERSLSTGHLVGTSIEHQRGWLSSLDVVDTSSARYLVAIGNNAAFIGRWRVDGTGPISTRIDGGHDFAEYSPDGTWMLMGAPTMGLLTSLSLWNVEERRQVLETNATDAIWLHDGHLAIVVDEQHLRVLDPATNVSHDVTTEIEPDRVAVAAVGPHGLAFSYVDGHVDVFDGESGARTLRLQLVEPTGTFQPVAGEIAASPDGQRIYLAAGGLYEFDATTGLQVAIDPDREIDAVAVSRAGQIAVSSFAGTIRLLDPADLSVTGSLPGAPGLSEIMRFSADGSLLLASADDGSMSLYDVASGQRLGDPVDVGDAGVDLRPDGSEIMVTGRASGVVVWTLDPTALTDAACDVAGRNLTAAEWATYVGDLAPYHVTCPAFA